MIRSSLTDAGHMDVTLEEFGRRLDLSLAAEMPSDPHPEMLHVNEEHGRDKQREKLGEK